MESEVLVQNLLKEKKQNCFLGRAAFFSIIYQNCLIKIITRFICKKSRSILKSKFSGRKILVKKLAKIPRNEYHFGYASSKKANILTHGKTQKKDTFLISLIITSYALANTVLEKNEKDTIFNWRVLVF